MQINKIIGLLVLISLLSVAVFPAPALAAGRFGSWRGWGSVNNGNDLEGLDESLKSLENDESKMRFLNNN